MGVKDLSYTDTIKMRRWRMEEDGSEMQIM